MNSIQVQCSLNTAALKSDASLMKNRWSTEVRSSATAGCSSMVAAVVFCCRRCCRASHAGSTKEMQPSSTAAGVVLAVDSAPSPRVAGQLSAAVARGTALCGPGACGLRPAPSAATDALSPAQPSPSPSHHHQFH